jgi:hypothetical protein
MEDLEALKFEESFENILENEGSKITDVCEIVDRRTTGVHPDPIFGERRKFFEPAAQGIEKFQHTILVSFQTSRLE